MPRNARTAAIACVTLAYIAVFIEAHPGQTITISGATDVIQNAAATQGVTLSDAVAKMLAIEAVRQQTAAKTSDGISEAEAKKLIAVVQTDASARTAPQLAEQRVVESKVKEVMATLPADITRETTYSGQSGTEESRAELQADLQKQTQGLAESGLSVDAIRQRNADYIAGIRSATAQPATHAYSQAKTDIFSRLVKLTISTIPSGATVEILDTTLGETQITKKPIEPGKMYELRFVKQGFKTVTRKYYVAPLPLDQDVTEVLEPATAK